MYAINIQRAAKNTAAPKNAFLKTWAKETLAFKKISSAEMTVRLVDIEEISQLNVRYRQKKGPTNVLSFRAEIDGEIELDPPLLGDIIICGEIVAKEAQMLQMTADARWAHLVVHGVLHLLGHDHVQQNEAEEMETFEVKILSILGFANPYETGEIINHYE